MENRIKKHRQMIDQWLGKHLFTYDRFHACAWIASLCDQFLSLSPRELTCGKYQYQQTGDFTAVRNCDENDDSSSSRAASSQFFSCNHPLTSDEEVAADQWRSQVRHVDVFSTELWRAKNLFSEPCCVLLTLSRSMRLFWWRIIYLGTDSRRSSWWIWWQLENPWLNMSTTDFFRLVLKLIEENFIEQCEICRGMFL